jgi:hypothetical protein
MAHPYASDHGRAQFHLPPPKPITPRPPNPNAEANTRKLIASWGWTK